MKNFDYKEYLAEGWLFKEAKQERDYQVWIITARNGEQISTDSWNAVKWVLKTKEVDTGGNIRGGFEGVGRKSRLKQVRDYDTGEILYPRSEEFLEKLLAIDDPGPGRRDFIEYPKDDGSGELAEGNEQTPMTVGEFENLPYEEKRRLGYEAYNNLVAVKFEDIEEMDEWCQEQGWDSIPDFVDSMIQLAPDDKDWREVFDDNAQWV